MATTDVLAKQIFANITSGVDFSGSNWDLPDSIDAIIGQDPSDISVDALTQKIVNGNGVFDVIMTSIAAHLKVEHTAGRITGAEYAKVYIALVQGALANAVQFLLTKDQSKWAAISAQVNAMTAKAQFEQAKAAAKTQEATYALTVLKLATEDASIGLIQEQAESARGQTMDTRRDGVPIKGSVGKQKDLYTQQITSYQRSSELNVAKVFSDAWIAHKTIDEGIDTPATFNASTISSVLASLKTNVNL